MLTTSSPAVIAAAKALVVDDFEGADWNGLSEDDQLAFSDSALAILQAAGVQELVDALQGMRNIVNDSRGVAGYHLNGEMEPWAGFPEVDAAEAALAKFTGA